MLNLMVIEMRKWWRNAYIVILLLALSILGYISVLSTFYLDDILALSTSEGIAIDIPDPTADSLFDAFVKNYLQLGIIVCLFIYAKGIGIGVDQACKNYYAVRSQWAFRIYLPKVMNGILWCLVSFLFSYALVRYAIWILYPDLGVTLEFYTLIRMIAATLLCLGLSTAIGVWSNSLIASVIFPVLGVYVSSFLNSFDIDTPIWLPVALFAFDNSDSNDYSFVVISVGVAVLFILLSWVRPLRKVHCAYSAMGEYAA